MSAETTRRHRSERGIALIVVLWTLALLSALALGFTATTRSQVLLSRNLLDGARARHAADAGVYLAIDALLDAARRPTLCVDGRGVPARFAGADLTIAIRDEAGKVDLNSAPAALLARLFAAAGAGAPSAQALAEGVAARRGGGTAPRRLGGAASPFAAVPFESVDELRGVPGMTPDLFARVVGDVTVHAHLPGIDPEAASATVLRAALGLTPAAALEFAALRGKGFACRGQLTPPPPPGTEAMVARSHRLAYGVTAEAVTTTGAVFRRAVVVWLTTRPDRPYLILDWREGRPEDGAAVGLAPG